MTQTHIMVRITSGILACLVAAPLMAQAEASAAPPPTSPLVADAENTLYLDLSTGGRVAITMRPDKAPAHVERIKELTRRGFYNGLIFHRVIEGFMAQAGDPQGTGEGGSDLPDLKAEFNNLPHVRGAVSMARTGDPNSANSQFFIMFQPMLRLDRTYTVFGRVSDGIQWVDAIERGEPPLRPTRILQASIAADNLPRPEFPKVEPKPDMEIPVPMPGTEPALPQPETPPAPADAAEEGVAGSAPQGQDLP